MKFKKYLISISFTLITIIVIICLIRINMINSKTLSPLSYDYKNLNKDEEELLDEYKSFITDKTYVKIYQESNGDILIKLGDESYILRRNITLKEFGENIFDKIEEIF